MNPISRPKTLYEKLFQHHTVHEREDGTILLYIDRHLVHEVTSPQAFDGLRRRGRRVRKPLLTLATSDHNVPTTSRRDFKDTQSFIRDNESRLQCLTLEHNVKEHDIKYFGLGSDRQGIVHVIGPELGFTLPGSTVVCGDSHTSTHGAFGSLAFGIGTTEVEHVLASQTLVTTRNGNMKVQIDGDLGHYVTSKDVILHTIGVIGTAAGTGMVIEFAGTTIQSLTMESRMSLCNMSIEAGAKAGIIAPDETTYKYLKGRPLAPHGVQWQLATAYWATLISDPGAKFERIVKIDAGNIVPTVSWGTSPEQIVPITGFVPDPRDLIDLNKQQSWERALQYMGLRPGTPMCDIAVDVIFIGSCTNGRIEDFRSAAHVLKGKRISPNLKVAMAVPGSVEVKRLAEAEGLDVIFKKSGFQWRESGCSLCVGLNDDMLMPLERCASTSNRNFEGRQGAGGRTHLMSSAMAASAAINGRLADVRLLDLESPKECAESNYLDISLDTNPIDVRADEAVEIPVTTVNKASPAAANKSFQSFTGSMAPLDLSNVDTDCIMPKQFCKTILRTGLGEGLFYNLRFDEKGVVRPNFILNQGRHRNANILLVTGPNFGCGSSREHAVWALQDFGFQCVLAPSFADIFYNNAFKNGLLPVKIDSPLVLQLIVAEAHAGREITVDLVSQKIFDWERIELGGFRVEDYRRLALLHGLDDLDLTLQQEEIISVFEAKRNLDKPWIEDTVQTLGRIGQISLVKKQQSTLSEAMGANPNVITALHW